MISKLHGLCGLLLLGACTSDINVTTPNCPDIIGVETLLTSQKSEIIVIGEVHGMTATPEFVSVLICHSLAQGVQTTLALEMSDDDGVLATYMKTDGNASEKAALFKAKMWTTGFTDGRSSMAMFDLVESTRSRMAHNKSLRFGVFAGETHEVADDATPNETSSAWEKHMGENIVELAETSERTIVLVGNLHARYGDIKFGELNYASMVEYLPKGRTRTFNALNAPGTIWNCIYETKACESHGAGGRIAADHPIAQAGQFRVLLKEELAGELGETFRYNPSHYDGLIYVGASVASPPANAEQREPFSWP